MSWLVNYKYTSRKGAAYVAVFVMVVLHIVGAVGLNLKNHQAAFENLAALNLFLSFILVLSFHRPMNTNLFLFLLAAFLAGMAAEIAGVATGYPFGSYYYTETFGPQLFKVPVIIGLNWALLGYVCAVVVRKIVSADLFAVVTASVLMVAIDLLLEQFAIRHHFWVWQAGLPPLRNYIAWFFISLFIQFCYRQFIPNSQNVNALPYLVLLITFLSFDLVFTFVQRTFF